MTEITFENVPGYFRLKVEGHAGYGCAMGLPEGHDIVCAAVSAMTDFVRSDREKVAESAIPMADAIKKYKEWIPAAR